MTQALGDTDHEIQSISSKMKAANRQQQQARIEFSDLARTFVVVREKQRAIPDLFLQEWASFLQKVGHDITDYHESLARENKRLRVINDLIEARKIEVIHGISSHMQRLFLVPTHLTLTCAHLAGIDRWDTRLCCRECHQEGLSYAMSITGYQGHRCSGEMCCRGAALFYDFPRISMPLPVHSDEW